MPISIRNTPLSSLLALGLAALPAVVHAQSTAGSYASLDYSFALSAADTGRESDVVITDNGELTYNLVVPFNTPGYFAPYTAMTGSGTAFAEVNSRTNYDPTGQSGNNGINSRASETDPTGTATASVGSQENLSIENTSATSISFDVMALLQITGDASATGTSSSSNFATVDTYGAIYDFNLTTLTAVANPGVHISGSDSTGITTTTGGFTPITLDNLPYYYGTYTLTIAPGETHALEFYTSSKNVTSASPVPEPAPFAALGLGALALLRRRRS